MTPPSKRLPYGRQEIDDDDIAAVSEVLRGDWLTGGPAVERFEAALCEATGAPHAVVCSSGTAALHLAAMAIDLGPGDWLIAPALTFLATANAARYVGAEVWFADVDAQTGLLTSDGLAQALEAAGKAGKAAKAVFPVHLNGQVADPLGIQDIAKANNLRVVEDCCHALATTFNNGVRTVGDASTCDLAAFSFHPVKTIAMGEGGAITTRDEVLADRLRLFRNHGMTRDQGSFTEADQAFAAGGAPNPWYYEMPEPGFNYRASDLHCALGASQLSKLDRFARRRKALAARYDAALAPLAPLVRPVARRPDCDPVWHLYAVLIEFEELGLERAAVMDALGKAGIGTQVHYLPVNRQPYYRQRYGTFSLPGADAYYERVLSVPLFPSMDDEDVDRVVESLATVAQGRLP